MFVIAILMIFLLKINETVPFQSGEILSRNAPIDYRAPYEATLAEIRVQEGDAVNIGDTLIVLHNEGLLGQYHTAKEGYWLTLANINLYKQQLENLDLKIVKMEEQVKIVESKYYSNHNNRKIELTALEKQVKSQKENIDISEQRLEKEKELLAIGAISQMEYQEKYQAHLEKLNGLTDLQKQHDLQFSSGKGLSNTYDSELKQMQLLILSNDYELVNLKKRLLEEEGRNQEFIDKMELISSELKKLVIISDIEGYISHLFNTKRVANFVEKGTALITIRPKEEEAFYAKLLIPQAAVSKVDTGQVVHFKLDAYNFYQYGILRGRVAHISQQDTSQQFYLLADVSVDKPSIVVKSGFQVKGDIILQEVRLYQFILNRLFHTLDS